MSALGGVKATNQVIDIIYNYPQSMIKLLLICHGRDPFVQKCIDRGDILTVQSMSMVTARWSEHS